MDGGRWQRVKEIFSAALEKDSTARDAYLDAACSDDTELRAEVDSLLAAHADTDDSFIARPAARVRLGSMPIPNRSAGSAGASATTASWKKSAAAG